MLNGSEKCIIWWSAHTFASKCHKKKQLPLASKSVSHGLGVNDTQIDSIQYLNFAKKWFNSIFNSILFHKNSIQKIIQLKKI